MPLPPGVEKPALVLALPRATPQAAVLILHGGRADGPGPPPVWNLPDARMRPAAAAIARATSGHAVVGRVRYRCRGWNGVRADAARDALRALDELAGTVGPLPTVLVGHSMGGRAALSAASHPLVRAVVGLASWCPGEDPADHLAGRRIVLLHGDRDRVTDPGDSARFAARARAAGAEAGVLTVVGGDHAMLRRAGTWHSLTARTVAGLLGIEPLPGPVRSALDTGSPQRV